MSVGQILKNVYILMIPFKNSQSLLLIMEHMKAGLNSSCATEQRLLHLTKIVTSDIIVN